MNEHPRTLRTRVFLVMHMDARLRPEHPCGLGFVDYAVLKERYGLFKSLFIGHYAVLVLDAEYVVITDKPEVADKVAPVLCIVTVANGSEYP